MQIKLQVSKMIQKLMVMFVMIQMQKQIVVMIQIQKQIVEMIQMQMQVYINFIKYSYIKHML